MTISRNIIYYLKPIPLAILFLITGTFTCFGYTATQNYVRTIEPRNASVEFPSPDHTQNIINIEYVDGLGRKTQGIRVGQGGNGEDLIDLMEYDRTGKPIYQWLPVSLPAGGDFHSRMSFMSSSLQQYGGGETPYTLMQYEENAFRRPISTREPGVDLFGHSQNITYTLNDYTGVYSCRRFFVDIDGKTLCEDGNYSAHQLRVQIQTDPNGKVSVVFYDTDDRQIMVRRVNGSQYKDTYWVYDDYGDLRYMISPKAVQQIGSTGVVSSTIIQSLCYSYEYDGMGRLISKKLPGAEPIYYVYDKFNRPIFSQDGNQRTRNEWNLTKYDRKMRVAVEGYCVLPVSTRQSLQSEYGDSMLIEVPEPEKDSETLLFYSNQSGPGNFTAQKSYFYDNYNHWGGPLPSDSQYPEPDEGFSTLGLLTGSIVARENDVMELTALKYDAKGRIIQEVCRNYYTDYLISAYTRYNFRGQPVAKKRFTQFLTESVNPYEQHTEQWEYTYDNAERLTKIQHKYNENPWQTLSENSYDDIGRLYQSSYGSTITAESPRINTYGYNIRGQLTSQSGPHFDQTLYYTTAPYGGSPNYNGNISGSKTSRYLTTSTGSVEKREMHMGYSYDAFNQLTYSYDTNTSGGDWDNYNEMYSYDLNGNPTSIIRGYGVTPMQDINIGYNGNQMTSLVNAGYDDLLGQVPQIPSGSYNSAFSYDSNGNLTKDSTRSITGISYNRHNLPTTINFSNGNTQLSSYDANGSKFRRTERTKHITTIVKVNSQGDTTYVDRVSYKTNTRDYYGDLIKENGVTKKIYNEAGYLEITRGAAPTYHYYVKDYLGSIRAVVDHNGNLEQSNDYYPSGLPTSDYTTTSTNDLLHNGKEFSSFSGLYMYDNEARNRDPLFNRFTSIDPLAEKYPDFSPYAFCGNNPLIIADPSGKYWVNPNEAAELAKEVNEQMKKLVKKRDEHRKKLEKEGVSEKEKKKLNKKISEANDRIGLLNKGIENIRQLGDDTKNMYALSNNNVGGNSFVRMGADDGIIYIDAPTTGTALHEITHVSQSLNAGELTFTNGLLDNAGGQDLEKCANNEVEAYRMQYSFDGTFPGEAKNLYQIDIYSVGNISYEGKFTYPYINKFLKKTGRFLRK